MLLNGAGTEGGHSDKLYTVSCWRREIGLCGIGLESGIRLLVLGGRNCAVIDYVNRCNTSLHLIGW